MSDLNDKAAKNHVEGVAGEAKGRVRSAVGELTGDGDQQLEGKAEQLALGDAADRNRRSDDL